MEALCRIVNRWICPKFDAVIPDSRPVSTATQNNREPKNAIIEQAETKEVSC
jgi:hypothetical protein